MSVLIRGMEMPESCEDCTFYTLRPVARCTLLGNLITSFDDDRLSDCPMVEVPTPHGRLIDADDKKVLFIDLTSDYGVDDVVVIGAEE